MKMLELQWILKFIPVILFCWTERRIENKQFLTCMLETGSLCPVRVWIILAECISKRWIFPSLQPITHLQLSLAKQRAVTGAAWPYRQWTSEPVVRDLTWTDWSVHASRRNVESQEMSIWVMGQLRWIVLSKLKSSKLQMHTQRSVEAETNTKF